MLTVAVMCIRCAILSLLEFLYYMRTLYRVACKPIFIYQRLKNAIIVVIYSFQRLNSKASANDHRRKPNRAIRSVSHN